MGDKVTLEEIKKNAPDGATHYDYEIKRYVRLSGGCFAIYHQEWSEWIDTHIMFLDIERCSIL